MRSYHWAKIWIEILDDAKMGVLSDRLWRRTIELILIAKDMNAEGYLPSLSDMAWRLRTNPELLEAELTDLAKIGVVERRNGGWFVTNFKKRQGKMDAAERKARQREREKQLDQRGSHDTVTPESRTSHDTVTVRDTRKEKIREEESIIGMSRNVTFSGNGLETMHNQEMPGPNHEADVREEIEIQEMMGYIAAAVKETCVPGTTEERFRKLAVAFIESDIEHTDVKDFQAWWDVQDRAQPYFYEGLPALTSLQNNIKQSIQDGHKRPDTKIVVGKDGRY